MNYNNFKFIDPTPDWLRRILIDTDRSVTMVGEKLSDFMFRIQITNEDMEKLWDVWTSWHHMDLEFEQYWFGYDKLSEETNIPIPKLRKIIKYFRDNNMAYHGPCINSEYKISGSGSFLKYKYIDLLWNEMKELIK